MILVYNNIKQLLSTSFLCFVLTSCTNSSNFSINKQPTSASPTPSPSTVEKNIFTITKVIKSNVEPNSLVDILSEPTGEIGQICSQIVQTDNNQTQNIATCVCQFTYTKRDGWVETWSTQPSYLESNLIRCPYQGVPLDSTNISVRIVNQATDGKSNALEFPLYGRQTALDSNHPLNYLQVRRYQCKDAIFIPNVFDGSIYDPFLSEDKYLTYPVNFFTTNMGGTLTQFVEKIKPTQGAGFICPSDASQLLVPQIFSFGTNQSPKLGLKMYPLDIQDEFDRQTFYLAKEKFGVFQIAFNTFVAPGLVTSEAKPAQNSPSSKKTQPPPPLGFAAQPYRYQDGEESCPADSFLPRGFRWVKVWQWRASLPARVYKKSFTFEKSGNIACNPGNWTDKDHPRGPIILDCGPDGGLSLDKPSLFVGNPQFIADRIDQDGTCNRLYREETSSTNRCNNKKNDDYFRFGFMPTGAGCSVANNDPSFIVPADFFEEGTDFWQPYELDPRLYCNQAPRLGTLNDPFSLCFHSEPGSPTKVDSIPFDSKKYLDMDIDGGVARYDILYVVSPVDIMSKHFKLLDGKPNSVPDEIAAPYTPYRHYTKEDCQDFSNPQTCPRDKRIYYGFLSQDASQTTPSTNTPPTFPLCAIQPTERVNQ